jgi:hypothetical protein
MAVLFPDIEKTVVAFIKAQIVGTAFASTRVATKKNFPDEIAPQTQIVVNVSYNEELNFVLKTASLTLEVFADDYATASSLGLWLESRIRLLAGDLVKQVIVRLGPVRMSDETRQEVRMIDVELLVKGTTVS